VKERKFTSVESHAKRLLHHSHQELPSRGKTEPPMDNMPIHNQTGKNGNVISAPHFKRNIHSGITFALAFIICTTSHLQSNAGIGEQHPLGNSSTIENGISDCPSIFQ
jgi:hypothetical protein